MIVKTALQADQEKCSSEDYAACALARQHGATRATESCCPFLEESLAQFCAAAPVAKYIRHTDAALSLCGGDSYRSCGLFLALERVAKKG